MSPARRKALEYFARLPNGTTWLDAMAPSPAMRRRMIADGQFEEVHPASGFGMVRFRITDKGRQDLEDSAT